MKFKVGDKVKIRKDGYIATITIIVKFLNKSIGIQGEDFLSWWCTPEEIELVEEKDPIGDSSKMVEKEKYNFNSWGHLIEDWQQALEDNSRLVDQLEDLKFSNTKIELENIQLKKENADLKKQLKEILELWDETPPHLQKIMDINVELELEKIERNELIQELKRQLEEVRISKNNLQRKVADYNSRVRKLCDLTNNGLE